MSSHVWLCLGSDLPEDEVPALAREFPGVTFSTDLAEEDYPAVDVVFTRNRLSEEVTERLSSLRWIQTTYGGGLSFLTEPVVERGITVTCSRGVQAEPLSEFTEACVLAMAKKLPLLFARAREGRWDGGIALDTLSGKVALLLGLGAVGSAVAKRLHKHGMRIRAIRRDLGNKPDYVESVAGLEALPDLLPEADFLIVGLPPLDGIQGLIGEAELRAMKETGCLVNLVTRGIVEDAALARALKDGWITGAACNVFETSPLPEGSELWDAPNLIISPGIAQTDPLRWQKLRIVFTANLARYLEGRPMENIVDGKGAY